MPALYAFIDTHIRTLEQRLRDYLAGELSPGDLARASSSVVEEWKALPEEVRQGPPEAHEDVLWHTVRTVRRMEESGSGSGGAGDALLHECLHLLESRMPVPQHYVSRRP